MAISYNPYSLDGKTILITGASSGIGRSTAVECSKLGARCVITGRNQERLQQTFDQLEGDGHMQVIADLSSPEGIKQLVELLPALDGLVNNAGVSFTKPIGFLKHEDMLKVYETNAFSPILLTNDLIKKKKINKGGSVVFVSSVAAYGGYPANSVYGGTKASVANFMHYCTCEISPARLIRFNSVHPGMVHTELVENLTFTEDEIQKDVNRYPLKRYGKPVDIAWAIIYLLSDASSWVTGSSMIVDGGRLNRM